MKNIIVLGVLTLLTISLATFVGITALTPNTETAAESATVEKVDEAKPAPLKQIATKKPDPIAFDTPRPSGEGHGFLLALLVVLTVALAGSFFLIFHLLNWRMRLPGGQISVVPEKLMDILAEQTNAFDQNSYYLSEYIKRISKDREKTDTGLLELQKAFSIFQESLDKKDKEIERYKKGYDSAIYEKFLRKFVKFYIDLKKEADAPENQQSAALLRDMLGQLEDALLECNVELKTPALMGPADEYKDIVSGSKKTKTTDQPELHGKIADVLMPAFLLKTQTGEEVLREATIAVYVYEESEAA